jgi:HSP20 family protein
MTLVKTNNRMPSYGWNNDFNSLLNRFFNDDLNDLNSGYDFKPAVNIQEKENEFIMDFSVPGMKKEDFRIKFEDERLIVSAELNEENNKEEENYTRQEFIRRSFCRTFRVSEDIIDSDKIKASYQDGILSLSLPKREEAKPKPAKEIAIK